MTLRVDQRITVELARGEEPIGELFEPIVRNDGVSPFIRVEMSADEVEFFSRWHYPWRFKPTDEFENWAESIGLRYEIVERLTLKTAALVNTHSGLARVCG